MKYDSYLFSVMDFKCPKSCAISSHKNINFKLSASIKGAL